MDQPGLKQACWLHKLQLTWLCHNPGLSRPAAVKYQYYCHCQDLTPSEGSKPMFYKEHVPWMWPPIACARDETEDKAVPIAAINNDKVPA